MSWAERELEKDRRFLESLELKVPLKTTKIGALIKAIEDYEKAPDVPFSFRIMSRRVMLEDLRDAVVDAALDALEELRKL